MHLKLGMKLICSMMARISRKRLALRSSIMQLKSIFINDHRFAPVIFLRYESFALTFDIYRHPVSPRPFRDRESQFPTLREQSSVCKILPIRCSFRGLCKYFIEHSKQKPGVARCDGFRCRSCPVQDSARALKQLVLVSVCLATTPELVIHSCPQTGLLTFSTCVILQRLA